MSIIKTLFARYLKIFIVLLSLLPVLPFILDDVQIYSHTPKGAPLFSEASPNKRFTVECYRSPTWFRFPVMPGQSGDGPGLFILRDNQTGKELRRKHVNHWAIYTQVWWDKDYVQLAPPEGINWELSASPLLQG